MWCFIQFYTIFRLDDYIQVLEKEINIDFCRSMNRIIFDKIVAEDPSTFAFVTVPQEVVPPTPEKGLWRVKPCSNIGVEGCCMDVPEYPFDLQYDNFAFNSLLTREEAINAIGKVTNLLIENLSCSRNGNIIIFRCEPNVTKWAICLCFTSPPLNTCDLRSLNRPRARPRHRQMTSNDSEV